MMLTKLLDTHAVAELLGCSPRKVKYLPIPIVRIGRSRRYDPRDVERYIAACKEEPVLSDAPALRLRLRRPASNVMGLEEALRLYPVERRRPRS
jgi:hypothetical protein